MADSAPAVHPDVSNFLSTYSNINDPGALTAYNNLAQNGLLDQLGWTAAGGGNDDNGNSNPYYIQGQLSGGAGGGTYGYNAAGNFPTNGKFNTTFDWQRPADDNSNLFKSFATSGPVLMAAAAALGGYTGVGEGGALGNFQSSLDVPISASSGVGPYASIAPGALAGLDSSVTSVEPYAFTPGAEGSIGTAAGAAGLGGEGLTTPEALSTLGTVGTGAPVTEMGKAFTGFGASNGVGSDTSAIVKSILGLSGAGSGGGGGGGILPLISAGSGIYGLYQAQQLRKLSQQASNTFKAPGSNTATSSATTAAIAGADPWGASGGRATADTQLQGLLKDPSSITSLPGYQAGLEAVQRSMAAQGYVGSGNMMAALSKYGGDFYNNAINQLSSLGGATQNPAVTAQLNLNADQTNVSAATGGAKLGLEGNIAANDMTGKALGNLGYAATGVNANSILNDPKLMALLLSMRGTA